MTTATDKKIDLEPGWRDLLAPEFKKPYMEALKSFLLSQKAAGKQIFPPGNAIFAAFNYATFDKVKVVILGQDPYHGPGQAHGLSFSVPDGVRPPPSLKNVFKEIQQDLGNPIPTTGNLTAWAEQGVLLLNAVLTVEKAQAGSHQGKGWESFTDNVISQLSAHKEGLVFLLWGRFAQAKTELIDSQKHLILQAAHPSPFAAHRGFFGCKHFSRANDWLQSRGLQPIDWSLKQPSDAAGLTPTTEIVSGRLGANSHDI